MRDSLRHPTSESLEAYAEGTLVTTEREVVASHLLGCPRCDADVDDWKTVLHTLSALPRFMPALGFGNRVMAHVRIPEPWHSRASVWIERLLPRSSLGWAVALAVLALPVVAGGSLLVWLLSKSYVTAHGLWVFATDRFASAATNLAGGVLTTLLQTDVAAWIATSAGTVFGAAGFRGVGALAAGGGILIMLSIWILYRNLFQTPNRGSTYVTFSL
ncbi:MAG: zf-HC2 domain-containing protein [Longimicrobiales bacterium]